MSIFDKLFNRQKEERYFFPVEQIPSFSGSYSGDRNIVVKKCVDKISQTISTLPLNLYTYTKSGKVILYSHPLSHTLRNPASEETSILFYDNLVRQILLQGNAYIYLGRNGKGEVVSLTLCNPNSVYLTRNDSGKKVYTIKGKSYSSKDILHIPYFHNYDGLKGISPVETHRELIWLYDQLQEYIKQYFNNSIGTRYAIELSPDNYSARATDLAKTYASIVPILNKYVSGTANSGKVMIPPPGSKLIKLEQNSNAQAELSSLLNMLETQIAGIFGVPVEVINSANQKYSSLEEKSRDFLQNCIHPLCLHISKSFETLLSYNDSNLHIAFDYKNLLSTDTKTTVDYLTKELANGILTINEVRAKLDLGSIDEDLGSLHWIPSNLVPITHENVNAYFGSAKAKMGIHQEGLGDDKS